MRRLLFVLFLMLLSCGSRDEAIDLYRAGMKEFVAGRLPAAEKNFRAAADKDRNLTNARLMLSKISYYNGDFSSALSFADSILNDDPDHASALYWKARSLVMSGESGSTVVELLGRSLEVDGSSIQARLLLAMIYEKNSQYMEAMREYLGVIDQEESIIAARGSLAMLYLRMGLGKKFEQELDRADAVAGASGKGAEIIRAFRDEAGRVR
jgi:tetratricopeptide (TPR) repeat protein